MSASPDNSSPAGLTLIREVVSKAEASLILGIYESEFDTWLHESAAVNYAAGKTKIPQMPHIPGRPIRFPLAALREWWFKYFVHGGEPEAKKGRTA